MEFLETARLYLRSWEAEDADVLRSLSGAGVLPLLGMPPHSSEEECRSLSAALAAGDADFALGDKESERIIGIVSLPCRHPAGVEPKLPGRSLTFALLPEFRGRGLMDEALTEMIRHAFEDIGLGMLWSYWPEGGAATKRLLEAHAFRPALERPEALPGGGVCTLHHMTLTWETWVDRREEERIFELLLSSYY